MNINMENFDFLTKFLLPSEKESNNPIYEDYKHILFPLKKEEIYNVYSLFQIPIELKIFYEEIGYGFFFRKNSSFFNRLLDPFSFKQINLREDFYEFDPDLELYEKYYDDNKLIFFEVCEGVYLLIDKEDNDGKNAIYYFKDKIANSLFEFLIKFDNDERYYVK
jgi:hypothetical protein